MKYKTVEDINTILADIDTSSAETDVENAIAAITNVVKAAMSDKEVAELLMAVHLGEFS